jgi:3-methylcrotonyl-CoA carboxylase alpha subunit
MIAKLIVHGADRADALRKLAAALGEYEVVGVQTNLGLLRAVVTHPVFAAGAFDTGFIGKHPDVLGRTEAPLDDAALAAAALSVLAAPRSPPDGDPHSPWAERDAWRMNGDGYQDLQFEANGAVVAVRAHYRPEGIRLDLPGGMVDAALEGALLRVAGLVRPVRIVCNGALLTVFLAGQATTLRHLDPLAGPAGESAAATRVASPIPARVTRILTTPGATVAKGTPLLVVEAMKTEITLTAPADGVVDEVRAAVGEMVEEGVQLVTFR